MQPIQQRQEPAKVFPAGELLVGDRFASRHRHAADHTPIVEKAQW